MSIRLCEVTAKYTGTTLTCPSCDTELRLPAPDSDFTVRAPRDVFAHLGVHMSALEREQLNVLLLNAKNKVIANDVVYVGNVSQSLVRIGELFRSAVRRDASGVILVHNHPSGDPTPSPDDLHLTAEAIAAGRLLDIDVLDHVVIGGNDWVSLRDRGVVFDRPSLRAKASEEVATYEAAPNPLAIVDALKESNPLRAGEILALGLMRGDRETLKLGYSLGSALASTAEYLHLTPRQVAFIAEQIAVPKPGYVDYGPSTPD